MLKTRHQKNLVMLFFFGIVGLLTSCSPSYQVAVQDTRTYQIRGERGQSSTESHPLESLISPYRMELQEEMTEVLGEVETDLWKTRPESPLGNFLGDVLLSFCKSNGLTEVDFVTLNYGGVRVPSIGAGPLTVERIFELMPFDNTLVTMKLSGDVMQGLLDQIAADGGWPISRGISFVIEDEKATNVTIGGTPFDPSRKYTVALPDYIANGGGRCTFLLDLEREDEGRLIRDILIEQIRTEGAAKRLTAKVDGRISSQTDK